MKRPTIITITNHKGGVGKTQLAVHLASYLLSRVEKILVLDFDPQAHATWLLCQNADSVAVKISDLLKFAMNNDIDNEVPREDFYELFKKATVDFHIDGKKMSLITSSLKLAKTKVELSSNERIAIFKIIDVVKLMAKDYDIVLIDTPPSLELLTFAALASSDYVLLPIQLDALAISGALDIMDEVLPMVRKYYNPKIKVGGVIINLHEGYTKVSKMTINKAQELFGSLLFSTKISRSVRVGELSVLRSTVDKVSPNSKSDKEFRNLTEEIWERLQKKPDKKEATV